MSPSLFAEKDIAKEIATPVKAGLASFIFLVTVSNLRHAKRAALANYVCARLVAGQGVARYLESPVFCLKLIRSWCGRQ